MRAITSTLLALSVLTGIAGRVCAQTSDSDPYYDQLDRQSRGGQGQGE